MYSYRAENPDPTTDTWDDGSRFALSASGGSCRGLIICVHFVVGRRVRNGVTSGPGGIRVLDGPCRRLIIFPASGRRGIRMPSGSRAF